jgi:raffinose/stachyose/melibiose transport system permease protein
MTRAAAGARPLIVPTRKRWSLGRHAYLLMLAPALFMYILFIIYPFFNSIRMSFYDWSGIGPMDDYVGLGNYRLILTKAPFDEQFRNAFKHNLQVFGWNSILWLIGGFCLALLLSRDFPGSEVYKILYFMPHALSVVIVGFLWNLMLNPQFGLLNQFLRAINLGEWARPWLGDPALALPTIIAVGAWASMGFPILVFLAAIIDIPADLIDAARIDGAGELRIIRDVTVPLLMPVMLTLIALNFIWSFEAFELIFAMEGASAGPFYATDVLGTFFYRVAFGGMGSTYTGMGLGAAITTIMLIIVLPVSVLVILVQRRVSVEY